MNLGTLYVTLGLDMTQLDGATKALNTTAQRFRTFGYLASATLTAPMVMAGKATFQLAKDYEYTMQKIVGLTGEAQDSVNAWSQDILKMGPTLGKTPQELAEALYYISSSGIKGSEAMKVLELSAKAAAAGLGETQTIANYLTSVLNAYKGTGLTAAYATDVLVAAVREGKAEATGFASAMGQVIPIAAQMGVPIDQVAGGMAAITLSGSTAAQSAIYLKNIFNSLWKESGKGASALALMNTSYKDLRLILKEQGLIVLLEKLRFMSEEYGDTLAKKVFPDIRALTGFLSVAGKNFEYNTKIMKEVTNSAGSLGVAWAAVSDTIKVRFDRALSQAQVSMISLGKSVAEAVIPFLEKLVQKLTNLTTWFDSLSEAEKQAKLSKLAFVAVLGPASLAVSVFMYTLSGLVGAFKMVISSIKAVGVAFMTNPYLAATVAVLALVNAVVLLARRNKEAEESQTALNNALKDAEFRGDSQNVSRRMAMLGSLDQRQLEQLQNDINTRIQLEKDFKIQKLAIQKEGIKDDQWVLDKKQKIWDLEYQLDEKRKKYEGVSLASEYTRGLNRDMIKLNRQIKQENTAITDYRDNIKNIIKYDIDFADANIRLFSNFSTQVANRLKEVTDPIKKAEAEMQQFLEEQEAISSAFAALGEGELYINRMTKILGSEFDTVKAKTELYNKVLTELANTTIPLTDKRIKELVGALKALNSGVITPIPNSVIMKKTGFNHQLAPGPVIPYTELELDVVKQLNGELAKQAYLNSVIGDSLDDVATQIKVYETALSRAYDVSGEGSDLTMFLETELKKLQAQQGFQEQLLLTEKQFLDRKYQMDIAAAEKAGRDTSLITYKYNKATQELRLKDTQSYLSSMATAVETISSLIEASKQRELSAVGDSARQREQIERRYFQKQKAWAIAQAVINGALAVTNLLAHTPGSALNPATWVGIGMAAASTAAQVAIISGQKMKEGGEVPAGFPNDTYPALLTSGERVIPKPKALNLERANTEWWKDVEFHIKNDELVGAFVKHGRKVKSYS
jgi:TP901 family phage tail tape measure protein